MTTADAPTDGAIASDPADFDFTLTDADGAEYSLSADGMFMGAALCESDINLDAPSDSRFGTVRFTPASTDDMTLTGGVANPLILDTTLDETVADPPLPLDEYADNVTVLHVYDFQGSGEMPNAAVELPATTNSLPLLILGFGALLASAGTALVVRRSKA